MGTLENDVDDIHKLYAKLEKMSDDKRRIFFYRKMQDFAERCEFTHGMVFPVASRLYYNEEAFIILLKKNLSPLAKTLPPEPIKGDAQMEKKKRLMEYLSQWGKFDNKDVSVDTYYIFAHYCYSKSNNESK